LWNDMQPQIPQAVPRFALKLASSTPRDLIGGLVAAMHLVSEVANGDNRDIARPEVSPLGRRLYYADLPKLIPPPNEPELFGENSKYEVLGAYWPTARASGKTRRALMAAHALFKNKSFRSIVFDYDGTLCSSNSGDLPPSDGVIASIVQLLEAEVIVGIASGRGGSIGEHLETKIDKALWPRIRLGLYNGGWIGQLGQKPASELRLSEFLIHAQRIVSNLRSYGVPISSVRPNPT
jgi:hypothetical protein